MKKVIFLSLVTLLLCAFNSVLTAQTDCYPAQFGCTDIENFTAEVEVPGYPGCIIEVSYDLRVCQGEFQIANVSLESVPFSDCLDLIIDYIDVLNSDNDLRIERFSTSFWLNVETVIADMLFQDAVDAAIADDALAFLYCGTGLQTFTASFYRGSCVSTCISKNEKGGLSFDLVSCGTTCCVKKKEYCIDPDTHEAVVSESISQVNPGECFERTPECGPGTVLQSPCFELCEPEK